MLPRVLLQVHQHPALLLQPDGLGLEFSLFLSLNYSRKLGSLRKLAVFQTLFVLIERVFDDRLRVYSRQHCHLFPVEQTCVHSLRLLCGCFVSGAVLRLFEEVLDLVWIVSILLQDIIYLFLSFAPLEEVVEVYLAFLRVVLVLLLVLPLIWNRVRIQIAYVWNSVRPGICDVHLRCPPDFRLQRLDPLFHVLRINFRTGLRVHLVLSLRWLCSSNTSG